jgi:hypothetical protein
VLFGKVALSVKNERFGQDSVRACDLERVVGMVFEDPREQPSAGFDADRVSGFDEREALDAQELGTGARAARAPRARAQTLCEPVHPRHPIETMRRSP